MILVTGGTGFVGTHLLQRMRKEGLPVRALVRDTAKAGPLQDLGVEIAEGAISDRAALERAAAGCERVIHLVGIIQEAPGQTFHAVHVDGTKNLLEASRKAGARHIVFQSALGTRPRAKSAYHRTKWEAEELVRASGIPFTILRPSLIYGPGDLFTVRLADMIRRSPVIPIIGSGKAKVQPLFIEDMAACLLKTVQGDAFLNEIYELGGPEQLTYAQVTAAIAEALGVKRPTLHLPLFFIQPMARMLETVLPRPPVTTDQLIMLQEDTVCALRDIRDAFGIEPIGFKQGLSTFLSARNKNT